jgi:hypothetical protein
MNSSAMTKVGRCTPERVPRTHVRVDRCHQSPRRKVRGATADGIRSGSRRHRARSGRCLLPLDRQASHATEKSHAARTDERNPRTPEVRRDVADKFLAAHHVRGDVRGLQHPGCSPRGKINTASVSTGTWNCTLPPAHRRRTVATVLKAKLTKSATFFRLRSNTFGDAVGRGH